MGAYKGYILEDGEVVCRGVDFESKLILHQVHGNRMVVKWKGGSHWAGLGQRGRHQTTLMIWRIDKLWLDINHGRKVVEFEATSIVEDINVRTDALAFLQAVAKAEKMMKEGADA